MAHPQQAAPSRSVKPLSHDHVMAMISRTNPRASFVYTLVYMHWGSAEVVRKYLLVRHFPTLRCWARAAGMTEDVHFLHRRGRETYITLSAKLLEFVKRKIAGEIIRAHLSANLPDIKARLWRPAGRLVAKMMEDR